MVMSGVVGIAVSEPAQAGRYALVSQYSPGQWLGSDLRLAVPQPWRSVPGRRESTLPILTRPACAVGELAAASPTAFLTGPDDLVHRLGYSADDTRGDSARNQDTDDEEPQWQQAVKERARKGGCLRERRRSRGNRDQWDHETRYLRASKSDRREVLSNESPESMTDKSHAPRYCYGSLNAAIQTQILLEKALLITTARASAQCR